jgi:hypothetical protein
VATRRAGGQLSPPPGAPRRGAGRDTGAPQRSIATAARAAAGVATTPSPLRQICNCAAPPSLARSHATHRTQRSACARTLPAAAAFLLHTPSAAGAMS